MKFNFSLSTKLFINNLFYAVPILVLLYLMFSSYNKELLFSQKELLGNDIQKVSMQMLNTLIREKSYKSSMDAEFGAVMQKFRQYESDLLLDKESLMARKREHISESNLEATYAQFREGKVTINKMIKVIRELIIHTGDTSNLILDPDLDSYYLMDVTLIAAPQLAERLFDLRAMLMDLSTKSEGLNEEDKIKLAVMVAMVNEADWGRIAASTMTAINEDKNFYGNESLLQNNVVKELGEANKIFADFITTLDQVTAGDKEKITSALTKLEMVVTISKDFYILSNNTLTALLKTREAAIITSRNQAMMIGLLSAFLALLVSVLTSKNFKQGTKKISEALSQLMGAVTINAQASEKLTETSSSLSSVSSQQASAVQETMSSLFEINSMSEKNSEHIRLSTHKSDIGKEQAIVGKEAITKMATTIKSISETNQRFFNEIQTSNDELRVIVKIISDISERTKVINDIVFQTRLLSFNASVEAARAGEHGKGFAVVAEEIGKLAQISGNSAREINEILGTATSQVETIISTMSSRVAQLTNEAQIQLASGESITNECVHSLNEIVLNISELSAMMNDVSNAIGEQSKGYSEITKAIGQIDEGIHFGLGLSQETSQSAQKLHVQVGELRRIVKTIEKEVLGVEQMG